MDVISRVYQEGEGDKEVQNNLDSCHQVTPHKVRTVALCCKMDIGIRGRYERSKKLYAKRNKVLHNKQRFMDRVRKTRDDLSCENCPTKENSWLRLGYYDRRSGRQSRRPRVYYIAGCHRHSCLQDKFSAAEHDQCRQGRCRSDEGSNNNSCSQRRHSYRNFWCGSEATLLLRRSRRGIFRHVHCFYTSQVSPSTAPACPWCYGWVVSQWSMYLRLLHQATNVGIRTKFAWICCSSWW